MDPLSAQPAPVYETLPAQPSLKEGKVSGQRQAVAPSLLDTLLETAPADSSQAAASLLDRFLHEPSPGKALACWLGSIPELQGLELKRAIAQRLNRDVARLDALLNRQVNAILHHAQFQKLEASWRGLAYLVEQIPEGENIKVKVLNLSWGELVRDQQRAL